MLFQRRFHAGLSDGSIRLTFRIWSRPMVKVGGRQRDVGVGVLEIDQLEELRLADVTSRDARRAGFVDLDELRDFLRTTSRRRVTAATRAHRVAFHVVTDAAPPAHEALSRNAELSPDEVEALVARLERMDRTSRRGSWTSETLLLIRDNPRVAASRLAPRTACELRQFKADVRKLKKLGLTVSHEVGYELSPRGDAFVRCQ